MESKRSYRANFYSHSVVTGAVLLVSQTALAQVSDTDRASARTLMAEGRKLREQQELTKALERFQAADRLLHFPTTGLELGRAEAEMGMIREARNDLRRVADSTPRDGEPLPFQKAREEARKLADELAKRPPTLRVIVTGVGPETPVTITIDGQPLKTELADHPVTLSPGQHVVTGAVSWGQTSETVNLVEGAAVDLRLAIASPPTVAVPVPVELATPHPLDAPPPLPPPTVTRHRTNIASYVGFGAAGFGIVAGSVLGVWSIADAKSAEGGCSGAQCPSATHNEIGTARGLATASDAFFVVAGAGLGAGLIAVFYPRAATSKREALTVYPWLGAAAGGVRGTF